MVEHPRRVDALSPGTVSKQNHHRAVVAVSCGDTFTAAVTRDMALYTWGDGREGQLGHCGPERYSPEHTRPQKLLCLPNVASVATGEGCMLAVTKFGTVYSWGKLGAHLGTGHRLFLNSLLIVFF